MPQEATGKQFTGIMQAKETISKDYINILLYCKGSTISCFSPSFTSAAFLGIAQHRQASLTFLYGCKTSHWWLGMTGRSENSLLPEVLLTQKKNFIHFNSSMNMSCKAEWPTVLGISCLITAVGFLLQFGHRQNFPGFHTCSLCTTSGCWQLSRYSCFFFSLTSRKLSIYVSSLLIYCILI